MFGTCILLIDPCECQRWDDLEVSSLFFCFVLLVREVTEETEKLKRARKGDLEVSAAH